MLRQPFGEIERIRSPDKRGQQAVEFVMKLRICLSFRVLGRELIERVHQRFGNESPTKFPEPALSIGNLRTRGVRRRNRHRKSILREVWKSRGGLYWPPILLPLRSTSALFPA